MNRMENGGPNMYKGHPAEVDLREFEGGKFIYPSPAEGPDIHQISSGELALPVSLTVKDGHFRLNGMQEGTDHGAIISGIVSGDAVKINHIELAEELRGTGLSRALLADLELQLKAQGTKSTYSAFAKPQTVDFFLKNGYAIIPSSSLDEELKKRLAIAAEDFDPRVNSKEAYEALKAVSGSELRKILLTKNLD